MGCRSSTAVGAMSPQGSASSNSTVLGGGPLRGPVGAAGKVFPVSPAHSDGPVSVVPLSPSAPAGNVKSPIFSPKKPPSPLPGVQVPPDPVDSGAVPSGEPQEITTPSTATAVVEDPVVSAFSEQAGAGSGSGNPLSLSVVVEPSSPRRVLTIGDVVSAKAAAARKRRGTVESTEVRESLDGEGHKMINQ